MYCVNCGVKLGESEKKCPLCGLTAFHPELPRPNGEPLYPAQSLPAMQVNRRSAQIILTALFLLPLVITMQCDLLINRGITWSGYVAGALVLGYTVLVLPNWFAKPNPVVFVPIDFAAVGVYLMYIDLVTKGGWFVSFALPLVGVLGLLVTTVVTLTRYLRRGKLFVYGGALIALGGLMLLTEFLIILTFTRPFTGWSLYPLAALVILGGMLIFLGINRAAREAMARKLFI